MSFRPPLVALLACLLGAALAAQPAHPPSRAVRMGYYDAKPSCFRGDDGRPEGIFVEIAEAVARRSGWSLEFEYGTWDRLLDRLREGSIDLIPAIVRTPERESFAAFTDESVLTDWGVVFRRSGERISSILDLDRKSVGALQNDFWFSGTGSLRDLCASFGIKPAFRFYADYSSLFQALRKGEVEAVAGSNSLGMVRSADWSIEATAIVYNPIELRFAGSRTAPGGESLVFDLDNALKLMRRDSPELFSNALAKYQLPSRADWVVPTWLFALLGAASVVLVAVVVLLVLQRRSLKQSERRLRGLFEDSPVSMWEEDFSAVKRLVDEARAAGVADWAAYFEPSERVARFASLVKVVDVNRATLELLGYDRKEDLLESLAEVLDVEGLDTLRPELAALAEGCGPIEGESVHRHASGARLTTQYRIGIMPGYEDSWSRVLVSLVDVTEKKRASAALLESLAEKEMLLREIHHRVKNNLQIICSLVSLQMDRLDPASPAARSLADMEARVRAMALVHEMLYQFEDFSSVTFSAYARQLCDHLLEAYAVESSRVLLDLSVEELKLPLEKAIACGLLVNELVINALKHAFPDGRSGRIEVSMSKRAGRFSLSVSDDGVGAPKAPADDPERRPIGLVLVRNLAAQLGGSCAIESGPGMRVSVEFPE